MGIAKMINSLFNIIVQQCSWSQPDKDHPFSKEYINWDNPFRQALRYIELELHHLTFIAYVLNLKEEKVDNPETLMNLKARCQLDEGRFSTLFYLICLPFSYAYHQAIEQKSIIELLNSIFLFLWMLGPHLLSIILQSPLRLFAALFEKIERAGEPFLKKPSLVSKIIGCIIKGFGFFLKQPFYLAANFIVDCLRFIESIIVLEPYFFAKKTLKFCELGIKAIGNILLGNSVSWKSFETNVNKYIFEKEELVVNSQLSQANVCRFVIPLIIVPVMYAFAPVIIGALLTAGGIAAAAILGTFIFTLCGLGLQTIHYFFGYYGNRYQSQNREDNRPRGTSFGTYQQSYFNNFQPPDADTSYLSAFSKAQKKESSGLNLYQLIDLSDNATQLVINEKLKELKLKYLKVPNPDSGICEDLNSISKVLKDYRNFYNQNLRKNSNDPRYAFEITIKSIQVCERQAFVANPHEVDNRRAAPRSGLFSVFKTSSKTNSKIEEKEVKESVYPLVEVRNTGRG